MSHYGKYYSYWETDGCKMFLKGENCDPLINCLQVEVKLQYVCNSGF